MLDEIHLSSTRIFDILRIINHAASLTVEGFSNWSLNENLKKKKGKRRFPSSDCRIQFSWNCWHFSRPFFFPFPYIHEHDDAMYDADEKNLVRESERACDIQLMNDDFPSSWLLGRAQQTGDDEDDFNERKRANCTDSIMIHSTGHANRIKKDTHARIHTHTLTKRDAGGWTSKEKA